MLLGELLRELPVNVTGRNIEGITCEYYWENYLRNYPVNVTGRNIERIILECYLENYFGELPT